MNKLGMILEGLSQNRINESLDTGISKNLIVLSFDKEIQKKLIDAYSQGKSIMITTHGRAAPNSFVSKDEKWTAGIDPKDKSYFDFELLSPEKIIDPKDVKMISDFAKKNSPDKAKKAYQETFKKIHVQYDPKEILKEIL
jgi:hypothetical protein